MAASDHAARNMDRRQDTISVHRHDVKLRLDVEAQEHAEKVILAHFPTHVILGEETPTTSHTVLPPGTYEWIVDPIDGTVNFTHGIPQWCTSVAVRRNGRMLAGVVYAPLMRELFMATEDGQATLNGLPISVSQIDRLDQSIVLTGLDKQASPALPPFAIFEKLALNTQKARIMGAAALDICHVACGTAEGYFEAGIYIWDVAAAGLIVQRAGGTAEVLRQMDPHRLMFLASNGRVHEPMKRLITEVIEQ
jgi:myo-inositol-1(or 4)-monophosphatase